MKIKNLDDVVEDIKDEGKDVENKDEWWAGKGNQKDLGDEWFVGHPEIGLYQFKSYRKNPYTLKGVGTKLTKNIDDEIESDFEKDTNSMFGILPNEIKKSRKRRTEKMIKEEEFKNPTQLFKKILDGLGINIRGNLSYSKNDSPKPVRNLRSKFEEEQKQLTEEFRKILNRDEVYNSYI